MFGKFFIFFSVAFDDFLLVALGADNDAFGLVKTQIFAVNNKKFAVVSYILRRNRIEIALSERQMIDGIQHIGFTNPIISDKTVDFMIELKIFGFKVFIVN